MDSLSEKLLLFILYHSADGLISFSALYWWAVQHERGPRKPKLQHLQGNGGHPGHPHLSGPFVNGSSFHSHAMAHFPAGLHHSAMSGPNPLLHHPQPLSFAPLGHHHLPPSLQMPPVKLEQGKFEFPLASVPNGPGQQTQTQQQHHQQQQHLSPIKIEHPKPSGGPFEFTPSGHVQHMYRTLEPMPPSPTDSKSSISVDSPSESLTSPQSTVDGSSSVLSPTPINATSLSLPSPLSQNGVLDILMSSDKCQEFIQYQMHHHSLAFPGFTPSGSSSSSGGAGTGLAGSGSSHPPSASGPPPPLVPHPVPLTALPPDGPAIIRLPTWEILQETTARLLFMSVRWVRCLIPFQTLSKNDQHLLLQESWKELFLLNFAQWSVPWDLSSLLDSPQVRDRLPQDAPTQLEMKTMQEILCRFRQISPDLSELGCMKAVILFSPETSELCDVQPVEMLQDQAQSCPVGACARPLSPPANTLRRLLLLLPLLPHDPLDHHRDAVLQGNHRFRAHFPAADRHVPDGKRLLPFPSHFYSPRPKEQQKQLQQIPAFIVLATDMRKRSGAAQDTFR
ncbi:hypothetical protein ZHAS_00012780 [Anopheles sinensis]|uniref:NR LBD domain-containing protein n=1 Tax=Anopheles sinensis TaxID=74873 RepID=A0A084W3S5_ANOSI|nr:hypothetical protein ZHAS_00012780 [Anopheles sinensis]